MRGNDAVHARVEEMVDVRSFQDGAAVLAGRNHRAWEARITHCLDEADRRRVYVDTSRVDHLEQEFVLAGREARNGLGGRGIVRGSVRKIDVARGEERAHAVLAQLAVDVACVVVRQTERP